MKKTLLFLLAIVSVSPVFAQFPLPELGVGYTYSAPTRGMKNTIQQANGVNVFAGVSNRSNRLTYGVELNYGIYGRDQSEQEYQMSDGTLAPMNIIVSNSFTNLMAVTRLNLVPNGTVQPYALIKGGYSWYNTRLNIYDLDDQDSCEPVETALLQKDGTMIYSLGGGLQINLSNVFKRAPKNFLFLDLQSSITSGGRVNYMNTDAPSGTHQHHHGTSSTRSTDLTAPFLNTQTQIVHAHHVGSLYTSFVNMIDFRLGFTIKPVY
jgi:hypothetical protein